jgi:hypothetical protein
MHLMRETHLARKLSNEDRMILAETFAARAEEHLATHGQPDFAAAIGDATSLCDALGIAVKPTPNAFAGERERIILASGYAVRITEALAGHRTRDLPRFVEGLCHNLGIDIDPAEHGAHTRDVVEHVELTLRR